MPAGQVNFRGSLPSSENNVLQPMLHPVCLCGGGGGGGGGGDSFSTQMNENTFSDF